MQTAAHLTTGCKSRQDTPFENASSAGEKRGESSK
jgi:hypothetical protein